MKNCYNNVNVICAKTNEWMNIKIFLEDLMIVAKLN